MLFSPLFFLFFLLGKNILGHFKHHFVPQVSSQSLKQGHVQQMKAAFGNGHVQDIVLMTSALGKSAWRLDPDLMSESSIHTIKDKNME